MLPTEDDGGGASYPPFTTVQWFWYWTVLVVTQAFLRRDG